jgi:hypothetical protein
LVEQWFETAMVTTPDFIDYLETNLPGQKFASPEVKQTISAALENVNNEVEEGE